MVQIYPGHAYSHDLARQAVEFLQTRDPRIFPFAQRFDDARMKAFLTDLREALASLTDSGSARKTSASGFIMNDARLHRIVREWAAAGGGWPRGADPRNPVTSLGSVTAEDRGPGLVPDRDGG